MRRYAYAIAVIGALTLTACGSNEQPTATPEPDSTTTAVTSVTTSARATSAIATPPEPATAEYWLRENREGYLTMIVASDYTDEQLEDAFLEVRRMYGNTSDGGWHVQVDCGDSQMAEGGARQANGRFALDNLGAAQTGLSVGGYEFQTLPSRTSCLQNG